MERILGELGRQSELPGDSNQAKWETVPPNRLGGARTLPPLIRGAARSSAVAGAT